MLSNSLIITAIVLLIILAVPILCEKIHIPAIIGLILAGVIIGPHGTGWIGQNATIEQLGGLGLLYLMFMSGIEINLSDLQKEKYKSIFFGFGTFFIPCLLGWAVGFYLFRLSLPGSILLGSMMGSHTLITYPVVSRYNIQRNRVVNLIIGGTIVAVTAAMIVLAVIASTSRGNNDTLFWLRMAVGSVVMLATLFYGMPYLAERIFKRYNDAIVEFTFVILMATTAGVLAWLAGLEPVLGVFLAGLALNRQIPNLSPLMNKINFVGNALFIPIFLIYVGMLVDLRAFVQGWEAILVAIGMTAATILGKWLAALLAQRTFRLTRYERQLTFGLSSAKAAASLAAVTIGYGILLADGSRLLDENILNGTVVMILITCTVSSILTEHAAKHIALSSPTKVGGVPEGGGGMDNRMADSPSILIPIANPGSNRHLVELATMITEPSASSLHALGVFRKPEERQQVERTLDQVARLSAATDHRMNLHTQVAVNVPNGILNVANAEQITHILAGMTAPGKEPAYGNVLNALITSSPQGLWIYHPIQPLKTINNVRILAPENAEKESGYNDWRHMVARIIRQTKADVTQEVMTSWTVLPRIAASLTDNDLLIVVQARPSTLSFHPDMEHTPDVLRTHLHDKNYLVIFPQQSLGEQTDNPFFSEFTPLSESSFAFLQRIQNIRQRAKETENRVIGL